MDLINYLPEGSLFKRGAFKRWNDDENSTRLVLTIPHSVSATWGTREIGGSSDLTYVLQSGYKIPSIGDSLEIGNVPVIGNQTTDLLRGLVDSLRPKTSHSISETATGAFDLRALSFVLGATLAAVGSGGSVRLDPPCNVRLLSPGWTVPSASEVTIAPGIARTPREFASLLALLGTSGTRVAQVMADSVPTTSARILTGNDLGAYCLRLVSVVLSSAQNTGCADHHFLAFFRGMNHSLKLWSHSDEGGWVRKALSTATYPASCGVVSIVADTFLGLSTRNSLDSGYVPKLMVSFFLTLCGIWITSDVNASGSLTVLRKVVDGPGRPSSIEGLEDSFFTHVRRFRHALNSHFDLHASGVMDTHSFARYFAEDKVDNHLGGEYIIPFWWAEPSALVVKDVAGYDLPAILGFTKKLPFCKGGTVYKGAQVPEVNGRVFGGCKVIVKHQSGGVRMNGMSYVLSSAYNKSNGLSRCNYVTRPDLGTFTTEAAFVPEGATNGAERRWVTPHNPMPCPVEGLNVHPLTFEYLYSGVGKEPTLLDWSSGEVYSGLGLFTVSKTAGPSSARTHRCVPAYLRDYISSFNNERPLNDLSILSEFVASSPPETDDVALVYPPEDPDTPPPSDPVKITTLRRDDPSPEYAEEIIIRADASAGAKIALKYVPIEDESSPTGDRPSSAEREE